MGLPAKPTVCPDCARLGSTFIVESKHNQSLDGIGAHQWTCTNCGWRDRLFNGPVAGTEVIRGRPHKDWHSATGHDRLTAADLALPGFAELTFLGAAQTTWTNMPLLATEFGGTIASRTRADLTGLNQARLLVSVVTAGAMSAEIRCRYSTDQTTWNRLDPGDVLDPEVEVAIGTTGLKESGWATLTAGAKADVFLRLEGEGGDLLTDPVFGKISLQVK